MSASLDGVRGPVEIPKLQSTTRVSRKEERPDEEARKRKQPSPKPPALDVSADADESTQNEHRQNDGHMDCLV